MLRPRPRPAEHENDNDGGVEDSAVRTTDSDALLCRVAAASLGYVDDPSARLFLPPALRRGPVERRSPLLHLGTHARTWAIDRLVTDFLLLHPHHSAPACQVLSLGAGTDSRFWRLRRQWEASNSTTPWPCARWVEVDFAQATAAKARTIASTPALRDPLGPDLRIELGGQGLSSPLYALLPADLRSLPTLSSTLLGPPTSGPATSSSSTTAAPPLSPNLPTLLLLECVLVYLPPDATDALLAWFVHTWGGPRPSSAPPGGAIVSYDPFGLEDSFGQVMRRNLATRGLSLPGAASTPTLASLSHRLQRAGVRGSTGSRTVRAIRDKCLPRHERDRVNAIERIDEVEELHLVLEHYAVTWGNLAPSSGSGPEIGLQQAKDNDDEEAHHLSPPPPPPRAP